MACRCCRPSSPASSRPSRSTRARCLPSSGASSRGAASRPSPIPFGNPIQLLALDLSRRLDAGELSLAAIEQLVHRLTTESFVRRAGRLRRYLGESDGGANRATIRRLIEGLAHEDGKPQPVPFETFRARVESERFGIVITAHPTFALASELRLLLTELALEDGERTPARQARLATAGRREHRPDRPLDLEVEHRQSLDALVNLHGALAQVYGLVFEVAEALYPDRWTELSPRLLTFASWVGYDLDGRSDIPWTVTFAKRLKVQILQLERYRVAARALRAKVVVGSGVGDLLELLEARLALAVKQAEDEMAIFADPAAGSEPWRGQLARAARAMHAGGSARLVDAGQLLDLIERALRTAEDATLRRGLCILRAEIRTHGLGLAHTHTRLNARQVHNAIRKTIGMDHSPDDPSHRLSYLNAISALIDQVEPARINFGSLLLEKATAKRTFMIIAQLLEVRRCDPAGPLPDRRVRDRLHAADRALFRQAVRGRGQGRDLAPVRDADRARAGQPGDRRRARRRELSRLCPAPRPALRADRLLRRRPLARPDRGGLRDRAAAPRDRPRAGAPGPRRGRARDLRHPWRIDRPRRAIPRASPTA